MSAAVTDIAGTLVLLRGSPSIPIKPYSRGAGGGRQGTEDECLGRHLVCPICDSGFTQVDNTITCANRHAFDVAREGYVNLLAALGQAPKTPGDTKSMLAARTKFVKRGFYRRLNEAIDELVEECLRKRRDVANGVESASVLDAGCGEGYVIGHLRQHLAARMPRLDVCYFGSDVSRDAIRMSARGHPGIRFFVASTWEKLPFTSIDVILNTFAPRNPSEFHRITRPGGTVVVAIPTAQHLAEARQTLGLLGIQDEKERLIVEQFAGRFVLASAQTLEYEITLDREDVRDLILMTPNFWHQSEEISNRVEATTSLQTTAGFTVLVFQKPIL